MNKTYICLDVGGTKILGGLIHNGELIKTYKVKTNTATCDSVCQNISEVIHNLIEGQQNISGIGIGIPGNIDATNGLVNFSPNLPFLNFALSEKLKKEFNVPVRIENDVNVGLLGEHWKGAAVNQKNAIGIFLGTGLGGAIIINNELIHGLHGLAGEFGHTKLFLKGEKCNCGEFGCAEAYVSKIAIQKQLISKGINIKEPVIKSSTIKELLRKNNKTMKETIKLTYTYLGELIGNLINCLDPDIIIIGGGVSEALGQKFLKNLKPYVAKRALAIPKIKLSKLGDHAILFGGVCLFRS